MSRVFALLCSILAGALAVPGQVGAADLKITFQELTSLLQSIASNTKIYLNNLPGGLFASQSYVQVSPTQQYPIKLEAKSFNVLGATYAYYVSDVASARVRLVPINGALRLTMVFESEGPEVVAGCISGNCNLTDVLPNIEWDNATVHIDFVPIRFNGSISLEVKKVSTEGKPRAVCKGTADFFERQACNVGLPFANRSITQLVADLPNQLRDTVNQPGIQQQLSEGLKRYLTLGQAGEIVINNISIDPKSMTVSFRFGGVN